MTDPYHACWVDHGQDWDPNLLRKHGIDRPYFDPRDPRITPAYLDTCKQRGFQPGLYFAWNWWPVTTGEAFAEKVDSELKRIGWTPPGGGGAPVCLDIELHDPAYINHCLKRWRQLRPTRQTDLTIEGMQGGWFEQCATTVIATNVRVVPQFYVATPTNPMGSHAHSPIIDLLMAGVPGDRLLGFYDARSLPYRWSGYAFTQGRLPA